MQSRTRLPVPWMPPAAPESAIERTRSGAEQRVRRSSPPWPQRRTAPTRAPAKAFHWPRRIRGSGAGRDTPDPSLCARSEASVAESGGRADRRISGAAWDPVVDIADENSCARQRLIIWSMSLTLWVRRARQSGV